jgi:SAM-dependent methyltransferase
LPQRAIYSRVYFRHKLKKLLSGQGFSSAKRHLRRSLHQPRFPLATDHVIETIDREQFEQIRRRYAVDDPGEDWPKYLDLDRWIDVNIRRVRRLELDLLPPQRILDLGTGTGYFAYIAKLLGHDVVALDIDDVPMFAEITRLLGLRRVIWQIQPFVPLPDLGKKFDVVTAFQVCFNSHKQSNLWGASEWEFFLNDLAQYLAPNGCVWLELNREYHGSCYTPELKEFFQGRGAKIDNHRVLFNSILRAPSSTLRAAH